MHTVIRQADRAQAAWGKTGSRLMHLCFMSEPTGRRLLTRLPWQRPVTHSSTGTSPNFSPSALFSNSNLFHICFCFPLGGRRGQRFSRIILHRTPRPPTHHPPPTTFLPLLRNNVSQAVRVWRGHNPLGVEQLTQQWSVRTCVTLCMCVRVCRDNVGIVSQGEAPTVVLTPSRFASCRFTTLSPTHCVVELCLCNNGAASWNIKVPSKLSV